MYKIYILSECKEKEYQKVFDMCKKLKVKEMSSNHTLDASFNKICSIIKWKTKQLAKYY